MKQNDQENASLGKRSPLVELPIENQNIYNKILDNTINELKKLITDFKGRFEILTLDIATSDINTIPSAKIFINKFKKMFMLTTNSFYEVNGLHILINDENINPQKVLNLVQLLNELETSISNILQATSAAGYNKLFVFETGLKTNEIAEYDDYIEEIIKEIHQSENIDSIKELFTEANAMMERAEGTDDEKDYSNDEDAAVAIELAETYPYQSVFSLALELLRALGIDDINEGISLFSESYYEIAKQIQYRREIFADTIEYMDTIDKNIDYMFEYNNID